MAGSRDRYLEAWQRTRRLYFEPENKEHFEVAGGALRSLFEGSRPSAVDIVATFYEALTEQDPGLAYDLRERIAVLGELAGKVCDIRYAIVATLPEVHYGVIPDAEVLSSGLEAATDLIIPANADQLFLPKIKYERTAPIGDRLTSYMDWSSVRGIKIQ